MNPVAANKLIKLAKKKKSRVALYTPEQRQRHTMPCFSKKKKDFGGRAGDGTYRIPEMDLHADVIKMWGKPFGDGGPRDAARLVHRVVVNNNGMANVGEHRGACCA